MRDLVHIYVVSVMTFPLLSAQSGLVRTAQGVGAAEMSAASAAGEGGVSDSDAMLATARARIRLGTREALALSLHTLEQTRDDDLREQLRRLLRQVRGEAAIDVFYQAMDPGKPEHVRALAVEVLASIGSEEVARRAAFLAESGPPELRAEGLRILSNIRNESSVSYLAALVLQNADEEVVAAAARGLGKIGTIMAVDYLVGAAEKAQGNMRSRVLEGLALVKNPDALDRLRNCYMSHPDAGVRAAIAEAFGHFTSERLAEDIDSYLTSESSEKVKESLRRSRAAIELRLRAAAGIAQ